MQMPVAIGAALLAALLPWSPPQQEGAARPVPHRLTLEERQAAMAEQLVGAWQLDRASVDGADLPALNCAGYLLVQDDYLALELHLAMPSGWVADYGDQPYFQSGIRRWRFDGEFQLETSALIGCTNITDTERWDFDPPGTKVTLDMVLSDSSLVLEQPGKSRLVFHKLVKLPFPGDPVDALKRSGRRGDTQGGKR